MSKKISVLILMTVTVFFSCRGPLKEEKKDPPSANPASLHEGDDRYFPIDTKQSVVQWKGSMQFVDNSHSGFVYILKGELMIENNQLVGGMAEIDMNTIEDDKHGKDNNLVNHLKDPDFFDVKKFPFASIALTRVSKKNEDLREISGNLTIKGITHPVSFPASVELHNGIVNANGKLVIDRSKWDVRYKSGKFFDNLADQTMSDSIAFDIKIVAGK